MDLGTSLKEARERAGVSLADLAARTRIPLKTLRAIEDNDFASIPPGIFVRSFIRTYAREVNLDPADAIATYLAMTQPQVEDEPKATPREEIDDELTPRALLNLSESRPSWGYALIVAALVIAVISVNRDGAGDEEVIQARPSIAAEQSDAEPASAVATTGAAVQIEMRAEGPCWVRAVADGQTLFARLMQPGERETVTAERDVVLRVGDPAAFLYSVNGRPGPSLGEAEVPVTVRFEAGGRVTRAF